MEKANVYLFTSLTCPHCPSAKDFMQKFKKTREDFTYKELITSTKEGRKLANKFQISSVPTFIIQGPGFPEIMGLKGTQTEEVMNKYLDIALGIKNLEKPKSFSEKLKDGIKIGKYKFKFE